MDDIEGPDNLLLGGTTANVEEVGRITSGELDGIHRGHGQSGSVHEAGDISIETNVAEIKLRRGDFAGIFFLGVAVGEHFG